ncbi:MAG: aldehyde dehydrogenase family protein [Rhodococcus sp. (in: high G+C Gram-positive bacteria)]
MSATTTDPQIEIVNPADGRAVGTVPNVGRAEVERIVGDVRAAQPAWEALGAKGRSTWLAKFRDWLLDHADEIADVLQSETGKPRAEARIEAPMMADLINYYNSNGAKFLADESVGAHGLLTMQKKMLKVFRPYPVVGIITPWNFPLVMPLIDGIPALMAGAGVLIKPSEVTPLTAQLIERGWTDIGAPPILRIVTGLGATGEAVVDAVDYVQFTGSTPTGRKIAQACAGQLKPYSLELGGKDPAIVLADADVDRAVNGVTWGGLMNSGQVCISVERVYVEAPIYDEFVAKLARKVGSLRQGADDRSFAHDVGALATTDQQTIVDGQVTSAIAAGARAVTGGKPGSTGTFYEPTVLVDVDHSMACMRDETFGPTIPVMKVADEAEAIRLANDSPFGLSATVWTSDIKRGMAVARQIDAGAVNINDAFINLFEFGLPHGGWKDSGVGARLGGAQGVRKYCRVQSITAPRIPTLHAEPLWYPYSPTKMKAVGGLLRMLVARDLGRILGRTKDKDHA